MREQVEHQVAVGLVGLGAPLAPPLGRGLGRVGEVSDEARPLDLLDDKAPARRALEREVRLTTGEALQPLAQRLARRRADPAAPHLTALQVERLRRDLPAVYVKCAYDLHLGTSSSSTVFKDLRAVTRLCRGGPTTCHLSSSSGDVPSTRPRAASSRPVRRDLAASTAAA